MNKNFRALLETTLYVLIIVGIAFGTPKILTYVMGTEYPIASITSGSMWPELKKGDMVMIQSVEKSELKVGDIIVYKNSEGISKDNSGFTIHRIIELDKNSLRTKGDANEIPDSRIGYDKIIGRTVNWNNKPIRIPQIGNLSIWISEMKNR